MPELTKVKWEKRKCPVCGADYEVIPDVFEPKTCKRFECVHKYHHPEVTRSR